MVKGSLLRQAVHWQYSGVFVPLFLASGITFMLTGQFAVADGFYLFAGVWAILWWITHDYVQKKKEFLRRQIERRRLTERARKSYWIAVVSGVLPIVLVVIAGLEYSHYFKIQESLKDYYGWLYPDNVPDPYHICQPTGKELAMYVGSYALMVNSFPQSLVAIHSVPVIIIDRGNDGAIVLSMTIRSSDGRVIVEMDNGEFTVNPNNVLRMYRPDESRLVVKDQLGNEVLNAHYLNKNVIRVEAKFYQDEKMYDLSALPVHSVCLERIVPPGTHVTGNGINLDP